MMVQRSVIVACCLLAVSAFLARASRAEPTPIREPLAGLSFQIGDWRGRQDPPLEPEVLEVLGADDYTVRTYVRGGSEVAGLFIGYFDSQRQGDTIHSPLNCLPGAGWTPTSSARASLAVPASTAPGAPDREIAVNQVVITKGLDRLFVLYWYQSHGRVVASEYWGKIYTVVDAIRLNRTDAALVRVIVPFTGADERAAEATARAFATELFPLLTRHLPS